MQTSLEQNTLRIVFAGDLLSTNVDGLRTDILAALAANPTATAIVADLVNARYVDSKGVNLLIAIYRESHNRKLTFRVENPAPDVLRLITLLNLVERFGLKTAA